MDRTLRAIHMAHLYAHSGESLYTSHTQYGHTPHTVQQDMCARADINRALCTA
eukprot:gene2602-8096_t